jgi:hypothetical protein
MRSATLRTGNGRSASPTDGRRNESTPGSTSSPGAAARSIGTSPPDTTGAWTSANTPPTSSFRKQADLQAIYENLARSAIHTVKPDNIATFLGRKLSPQFEGEMGNRFNIRIEGTRIKHTMGPVSIKLYDKFGLILRIETTVNDLTFFKHLALKRRVLASLSPDKQSHASARVVRGRTPRRLTRNQMGLDAENYL